MNISSRCSFFVLITTFVFVSLLHNFISYMRSFASDNNSGVHPSIMNAINECNHNHALGYGDDEWTKEAETLLVDLVGKNDASLCYALTGTGANVIALQACTQSFNSIICASTAHIAVDECGAPTKLTGCPLKEIKTEDGKLTPELVKPFLSGFGFEHHSQPKVIAISQPTEMGTVYTPDEIKQLANLAHSHNMYLFMDGARLANACASNKLSLKDYTTDCGVDIFTFGGAKNGLMYGEAVVSLRPELSQNLKYIRKQSTQLVSKMRYISAQFIAYLKDDLWIESAHNANTMAKKLAEILNEFNIKLTQSVDSNAVFFTMSNEVTSKLRENFYFYDWDIMTHERRMVCSWDTTDNDLLRLKQCLVVATNDK